MVNGFGFCPVGIDSPLGHDLCIFLFLLFSVILSVHRCVPGHQRIDRHAGRVLEGHCTPCHRQVLAVVFFGYLNTSNISTDSRQVPFQAIDYPSGDFGSLVKAICDDDHLAGDRHTYLRRVLRHEKIVLDVYDPLRKKSEVEVRWCFRNERATATSC